MIKEAIFDTGPLIHLEEINVLQVFKLFNRILVTDVVAKELLKNEFEIKKIKNLEVIKIKEKDTSMYFARKYNLHLGEASVLALAKQENIKLLFTDDLDARTIYEIKGYETHGSLGLILKAFRENIISKKECIEKVKALKESSLFITSRIIDQSLKELKKF